MESLAHMLVAVELASLHRGSHIHHLCIIWPLYMRSYRKSSRYTPDGGFMNPERTSTTVPLSPICRKQKNRGQISIANTPFSLINHHFMNHKCAGQSKNNLSNAYFYPFIEMNRFSRKVQSWMVFFLSLLTGRRETWKRWVGNTELTFPLGAWRHWTPDPMQSVRVKDEFDVNRGAATECHRARKGGKRKWNQIKRWNKFSRTCGILKVSFSTDWLHCC